MDVETRKSRVAGLSVASNATLVVLKIAIGIAIGSVSVVSEAVHSGVDLIASLVAFFAVRTSSKPADREHQFGHGKIENVSGAVEAILILFAAGWILWEASRKLLHGDPLGAPGWGVAVMAVSSALNAFVSRLLFKVGRETDSIALQADGWHLLTDVWTSLGVMIALGAIWLGHRVLPGSDLRLLDPLAAVLVALLIVRAAWQLTSQSVRDLLDASLPKEEHAWVEQYLGSLGGEVKGYHALRTRKAGPNRFVECHVLVRPDMSVDESHAITDRIVDHIKGRLGSVRVLVHVEPDDGTHVSEGRKRHP